MVKITMTYNLRHKYLTQLKANNGDSEWLKWFLSDIKDGHRGSHIEFCQMSSPESYIKIITIVITFIEIR